MAAYRAELRWACALVMGLSRTSQYTQNIPHSLLLVFTLRICFRSCLHQLDCLTSYYGANELQKKLTHCSQP